jgi:hypothetical protein
MDFEAWVVGGLAAKNGRHLIEVQYRPDLGNVISIVARGFAPRLSFWFETGAPFHWMGHRIPLYSGGPEVLVLRDGVPTRWVDD